MTWFGWLGLGMMVVFGLPVIMVEGRRGLDTSPLFGLAAFGFALLVWGAVAY